MNINLEKKNALVCGSTQGIGLASAQELASMGCNVILMARSSEKLEQATYLLDTSRNQEHSYLVADFKDSVEVSNVINEFVNKGTTIDILVNNTGGPAGGSIEAAPAVEFKQAFESHLLCSHALVQAILPGMRQNEWGRIINIISTSVKMPLKGLGVSNTIRAAVANWAKTLANEVAADGITVNNILPGFTETARAQEIIQERARLQGLSKHEIIAQLVKEIPVGRIGKSHEIAAAVGFLASHSAAYITGINLPVDGGRLGCL